MISTPPGAMTVGPHGASSSVSLPMLVTFSFTETRVPCSGRWIDSVRHFLVEYGVK